MRSSFEFCVLGVVAGLFLTGCAEPAPNPAWQAMCQAYCERALECLPDLSLSDCRSLCLDQFKDIPCEADPALLDECVAGMESLSCDEVQHAELPRACSHMCTGGLCEGVNCDDGNECTDDICNPVDGSCDNDPLPDGTPCSGGGCENLVCTSVFSCTEDGIRTAIATGGGPYTFACDGPTTIETSERIVVDNDVILDGEGNLTLDGRGLHTVLSVFGAPTDITVELHGFVVTGSWKDGAAILSNQADLTVSDCIVSANDGAGIESRGTLTVNNTVVEDNESEGISHSGDLTVNDSTVSGNEGIGVSAWSEGTGAINNTSVSDNATGGIHNGQGMLVLSNVIVSGNRGWMLELGGGISNEGTLVLNDSEVSGNGEAPGSGGISNWGTMTVTNTVVVGNESFGMLNGGSATINESSFLQNRGPGIANGGMATVLACTISGNEGTTGGGISNGGGTLVVRDSTVWENTAAQGGGIYNYQGTFTLTNCTVSGNMAVEGGGGIDNRGESAVVSSTISGNHAPLASAIVFAAGHMSVANSIIDGDCYQEGHPNEVSSDGGNIESPGDTCGLDPLIDQVNVTGIQLNLGVLQDNGGPTLTQAPERPSVAFDTVEDCVDSEGQELVTDQRGVVRPQGPRCDVGAVEITAEP